MNTLRHPSLLIKNSHALCFICILLLSHAMLWAQTVPVQTNKSPQITINKGQKISFPKEAILRYQSSMGFTGLMRFNQTEGQYQTSLQFNIPFYMMDFNSSGRLEGKQISPTEYTDMRKGKLYSQAKFDYQSQSVIFGKVVDETKEKPMQGIPQDYLSLVWQLALNLDSLNHPIQITNGKTLSLQDKVVSRRESTLQLNDQKIRVHIFKIDKDNGGLEFALAPDFANVPVQITLLNDDVAYTLYLVDMTLDGQDYWQRPNKQTKAQ